MSQTRKKKAKRSAGGIDGTEFLDCIKDIANAPLDNALMTGSAASNQSTGDDEPPFSALTLEEELQWYDEERRIEEESAEAEAKKVFQRSTHYTLDSSSSTLAPDLARRSGAPSNPQSIQNSALDQLLAANMETAQVSPGSAPSNPGFRSSHQHERVSVGKSGVLLSEDE